MQNLQFSSADLPTLKIKISATWMNIYIALSCKALYITYTEARYMTWHNIVYHAWRKLRLLIHHSRATALFPPHSLPLSLRNKYKKLFKWKWAHARGNGTSKKQSNKVEWYHNTLFLHQVLFSQPHTNYSLLDATLVWGVNDCSTYIKHNTMYTGMSHDVAMFCLV